MENFTSEQKVRQAILCSNFEHEESEVIRWITGGPQPSIYARFVHEGNQTVLYCPQCGAKLGQFSSNYEEGTSQNLSEIRESGSLHQQQHR